MAANFAELLNCCADAIDKRGVTRLRATHFTTVRVDTVSILNAPVC